MKKVAAAYCRYSSDDQLDESLEDQLNVCFKYANAKGIIINKDHIYTDAGTYNSKTNRPGLNALMENANNKYFDSLIVYDLSRISMSISHVLCILERLDLLGISVHSVSENINTSEDGIKLQVIHIEGTFNDLMLRTIGLDSGTSNEEI